jgi:thymidylate kinase
MIQLPKEFLRCIMITTSKVPQVIIFFGPDGSGKTTQANLLIQSLRKNGVKTTKLWLRSLHTLAFMISKLAMHTLHLQDVYEFRARYSHNKHFARVWYAIEFLSILPLVLMKLRFPLMRGHTIVAERYVIDWIVALSYATHNELLVDSLSGKAALKLIPKNSLLIFIDAKYDAIRSRGRVEDSYEFIEFQRQLYHKIARRLNATIIDTSDKSIQDAHESILHHISLHYLQ